MIVNTKDADKYMQDFSGPCFHCGATVWPSQPAVEVAPAQQVAAAGAEEEKPATESANGAEQSETSWLNQVITK